MSLPQTKILILGGGFGGMYAALRLEKTLARDADIEVTIVSRENFFLFTPMLHEVAASDLDVTHIVNPIRRILRKHVRFFEGEVQSVNLAERRVVVALPQLLHGESAPVSNPGLTTTFDVASVCACITYVVGALAS